MIIKVDFSKEGKERYYMLKEYRKEQKTDPSYRLFLSLNFRELKQNKKLVTR